MTKHDTLTQALQQIADMADGPTLSLVMAPAIAAAALSATQPAQAAQPAPVVPEVLQRWHKTYGVYMESLAEYNRKHAAAKELGVFPGPDLNPEYQSWNKAKNECFRMQGDLFEAIGSMLAATPTPPAQAQQSSVDAERAARQAAQVRVEELQAENIRLQSAADHACGLLKTQQAAGVPEASALVEALHKIKHKAVSLADAQVIALEALAAATEAAQVTDALKSARMATSQDDGRFRVVLQFTEFDDANAVHSWLMSQGVLHYNGPGSHATQAQAAADARDAERYRMVRRGQHWSVINGIGDTLRGEDLDAAIDAVSVGQR